METDAIPEGSPIPRILDDLGAVRHAPQQVPSAQWVKVARTVHLAPQGAPQGAPEGGGEGVEGLYPCSTDTLGSEQVKVCVQAYPDGGFDGSMVISRVMFSPESRKQDNQGEGRPELLEVLKAGGSVCLFCSLDGDWLSRRDDNASRSVRRSAVRVRQIARLNEMRRLMTFTNGDEHGGWRSRKECLDTVARFFKVHGRECFGGLSFLVVAERGGKRGRWHAHALCPQTAWLPYRRVIRRWSRFMEGQGYHSINGTHRWHAGDEQGKHTAGFPSARVAAAYASKYLTKDLGGADEYGSGTHRYRTVGTENPVPAVSRVASFNAAFDCLPSQAHTIVPIEQMLPDGAVVTLGYWFDGGGG